MILSTNRVSDSNRWTNITWIHKIHNTLFHLFNATNIEYAWNTLVGKCLGHIMVSMRTSTILRICSTRPSGICKVNSQQLQLERYSIKNSNNMNSFPSFVYFLTITMRFVRKCVDAFSSNKSCIIKQNSWTMALLTDRHKTIFFSCVYINVTSSGRGYWNIHCLKLYWMYICMISKQDFWTELICSCWGIQIFSEK